MGFTQSTNAQTAANGSALVSTISLKDAIIGLGASMKAAFLSNPIGIAIMAISTGIGLVSSAVSKYKQRLEDAAQATKQAAEEASDLTKTLSELSGKYADLSQEVKTDQSVKEDLLSVQSELLKALGLEGESVDSLVEKYGNLNNAITQVTLESLKKAETDLIAGLSQAESKLVDIGKGYEKVTSMTDRNLISSYGESTVKAFQVLEKAGIVSRGSYGTGGGVFVLTGDESIEGTLQNYERLQKVLSVLQEEFTATELKENDFYKKIYNRSNEIKPLVEEYYDAINSLNSNLAAQYVITSLNDTILPETKEQFEKFKAELNSDAINSGRFVGTDIDIT